MNYEFFINCAILLVTVCAIVYGPTRAVKITRQQDEARERRDRKYTILTDLMKTRRARVDPIHVNAINLIELEFYGHDNVLSAYRNYAKHLNFVFPDDSEALERHLDESDNLFLELLFQIAVVLEYSFDKNDLSRLAYLPRGLSRYQDSSHANTHLMREILEGRRAVPIRNFVGSDDKFPPAPERRDRDNG